MRYSGGMARKLSSGRTAAASAAKKLKNADATKRTRSTAAKALSGRSGALVVKSDSGWTAKKSASSRSGSLHQTREEAIAAALKLASGRRVIVHEEPRRRLADEVLALLIDTGDLRGGSRTTLRVPDVLERELVSLSDELGLTKNDALVRLALTGSQLVDRAREVSAKREGRREAVFTAGIEGATDDPPSLEEMREAAFTLRNK